MNAAPADNSSEVQDWLQMVQQLRPLERLALVGLLKVDPTLSPGTIDTNRIVGEQKCYLTGMWAAANFRSALREYCKFSSSLGGKVTLKAATTFVPILLASGVGLTLGAACGFFGWAVDASVANWCQRYSKTSYDGIGTYTYGDEFSSGDSGGRFSIERIPAITENVTDPNYPIPAHVVRIDVPEQSTGMFLPNDPGVISTLLRWREETVHCFKFRDSRSGKNVEGSVSALVDEQTDPRFIKFHAQVNLP